MPRLRFPPLALLACALGFVLPSHAQTSMPASDPTLRLVVPVAPGGSSDRVARLLAERLPSLMGRTVVVDNRAGANGRIAVDAFRALAPNAAALVAPIAVPVTTPIAFPSQPWGPRDFAPVAQLTTFDYALATSAAHGARTLADFVAWARARPEGATFAASGTGTVPHFAGLLIARDAGYAATVVPYGDIGKLEADLAGGHVASAVAATSDLLALHRAGRVRILATTGRARTDTLPDVPTFVELGYPGLQFAGWNALFASPRLTPADVESLSRMANEILRDPGVQRRLRDAGLSPAGGTPRELAAVIERDIARWTPVIHGSGFVP